MNRRGFLGFLGLAAAAPVIAKVVAEPRDFETATAKYTHREYAMGFEMAPVKREGDRIAYDPVPKRVRHIRLINKSMNRRPAIVSVQTTEGDILTRHRIRRGEYVDWYGYLDHVPDFRLHRGPRNSIEAVIEGDRFINRRTL